MRLRPTYIRHMSWSKGDSKRLAHELLGELPDRWAHVRAVAERSATLSGDRPLQMEVLVSASWLHDIGYSSALVDTGMHAIDGAMFLDREGAPVELVGLVAFHTGAEYEADERGLMDKLLQFDRPNQEWLDLLILADLMSGPNGERMSVTQRLDEIPTRYEPQHPVHRAILRSRPYLEECAARALARLVQPT